MKKDSNYDPVYRRNYYLLHKSEAAQKQAEYRAKHKMEISEGGKRDYEKNKVVIQERHARWREAHREYARVYGAQWAANNRDRKQVAAERRRSKEVGATGSHTHNEWLALLRAYDNKCLRCGTTGRLTEDHIIPLSLGGTNDISNIQPLCKPCNSVKETKTTDYRKFIVPKVVQLRIF